MKRTEARDLMACLNRDAERIAARFSLSYQSITAEHANVKSRYGICYSDGSIQIRLRHASSGRPLKYSSLVNTLCHELAHLRYFNHGVKFQGFYRKLLRWARDEGIYLPRTAPELRQASPTVADPTSDGEQRAAPAERVSRPSASASDTGGQQVAEQLSLFG
jgi:predicted metal-dependent hydrolase